ncbi:hypothetical protein EXN66_Car005990 [Channa argus]|uniref:Uncharacterized protein n=1 Tax=Channa argus TaxID=215402 RepID=A0A6G1PK01_CHAAH|nr:hypothetical protein EXN66_Car005990 [Channa argus]
MERDGSENEQREKKRQRGNKIMRGERRGGAGDRKAEEVGVHFVGGPCVKL